MSLLVENCHLASKIFLITSSILQLCHLLFPLIFDWIPPLVCVISWKELMYFVTPVMDVATRLWSCTSRHASYVINLEENMCSLRIEMEELRNVGEDVKRRVEDAENHQMRRRNEINGWLNRLDSLEREVNEILEECDHEIQKRSLRNFCSSNCRSSYNIGRRIREKIPCCL